MNLVFECRGQSVVENISRCWTQKPSDRVGGGGASSSVADFPSLQFVFVISSASGELSEGLYSSRKEGCPYMSYCGDFPEVHLKLSSFSLKDFGKEAVLIFMIPVKEWEKNLTHYVQRVVDKY